MTEPRRAELASALAAVRARIDRACAAANRPSSAVTLLAVTKFHPASDAAALADAGVTDLAESRDQEALAKVAAVAALSTAPVRWHFIGRLQTNKARSVAGYADLVHSVDRTELADALAAGVDRADREVLPVLVQFSFDDDAERGGAGAGTLLRLAEHVAGLAQLQLAGVMAIAPLGLDPDVAFDRLAAVSRQLQAAHPGARIISAGMSGDLEQAVWHGATHVRIGTALLGLRPATIG